MNIHLKIGRDLLDAVRADLQRPHPFAYERVGWLTAGVSRIGAGSVMVLIRAYHPVDDGDYIEDRNFGAMVGSAAIRTALQRSYRDGTATLHVHMHEHSGRPRFSGVDDRENAKFVPDFFNVAAHVPHGALVLSHDGMCGNVWLSRSESSVSVTRFTAVGTPMWFEGGAK